MKKRTNSRQDSLLLVGYPDSGKTAIFSTVSFATLLCWNAADGVEDQLAYNQTLPSHMSLQTNSTIVALSASKTLRVVDVPGHPRIRDQFRDHIGVAKAVVFVVDASTISRNGQAIAEYVLIHSLGSSSSRCKGTCIRFCMPLHPCPLRILHHRSSFLRIRQTS